jgi:hypothetical protein
VTSDAASFGSGPGARVVRGARMRHAGGVVSLRHPNVSMALISAASILAVGAGVAVGPMVGLAVLAAIVVALLAMMRPATAAIVLVAVVPAISGIRRGLPVPEVRLSELLIVEISLVLLLTADRRSVPRWRTLDWLALAYAGATAFLGTVDLLVRDEPFTADNAQELLGPFQFVLLYRATATALNSPSECRGALRALLLASAPVAVVTTMQGLDVPGVRSVLTELTGFDSAAQASRASGPFPQWHELGGYAFQVTLLALALWLGGSGRVVPRRVVGGLLALGALVVIETATLAPILGMVAGAFALGRWYRQPGRILACASVVGVVGLLAFGPQLIARVDEQYHPPPGFASSAPIPQTIAYRYGVWKDQYVPAAARRLMTGYGPGTPPEVTWQYTESSYVTMLVRGGLPLLLIFLALLGALVATAARGVDGADEDRRALARTLVVIGALMLPLQLVAPYFVLSGPPHLLWALTGVLVAWQSSHTAGSP